MSLLCQVKTAGGGAVAVDGGGAPGAARDGGRRGGFRRAGGDGGLGVGLEEVPDSAGEVALEAADGFAAGLAFGLAAGQVGGGLGIEAALGDGEAVQRAVELAVAAVVEAVALGAPGGGGDRRRAGAAGELGVGGEAGHVGDLAEQFGGGENAAAAFGEQPRRKRGDECGEFGLEVIDAAGEFADAAQFVASDAHARGLLGAGQTSGDARLPAAGGQRAWRDYGFGPEVVEVPAQVVAERGAL